MNFAGNTQKDARIEVHVIVIIKYAVVENGVEIGGRCRHGAKGSQ